MSLIHCVDLLFFSMNVGVESIPSNIVWSKAILALDSESANFVGCYFMSIDWRCLGSPCLFVEKFENGLRIPVVPG